MIGFRDFLTESPSRKNTHLTHIEDVILDEGPAGVSFVLNILKEFGKILDGGKVSRALNVSVKWDGAPALIFGPDPADGRFFVATKGAFAKNPKLAKTHNDIDAMYQSGVKDVLHLALDELRKLQPSHVIQGDVLFTSSTLGSETMEGKTWHTFQPNTIMYAVDASSTLGRQIASAGFGIVLHTMYVGKGPDLSGYGARGLSPSVFASLRKPRSVVVLDAGYDDVSGTATFTEEERSDFLLSLEAVQSSARGVNAAAYKTINNDDFRTLLQQFINHQVRSNQQSTPNQTVADLIGFFYLKMKQEMAARKTEAGKNNVSDRYMALVNDVRDNSRAFVQWFSLHQSIARAKEIVVRKLGQASQVAAFVRTPNGYKVTGPEGFVAVARSGRAVKLVDRLEFSRLNFLAPKTWQ